jgi:hypothetical protein
MLFSTKIGDVWSLIINQRLIHVSPHMFPCIDKIVGFLVETISWSIIRRCQPSVLLKMVVPVVFNKNGCCVAIDHWPEARTPDPTYISLPYIRFLDFWWRPFLGQKSVVVSIGYY